MFSPHEDSQATQVQGEVERLLKNNEEPSDKATQEVRTFLVKPLEELEYITTEIQHLEKRVEELKIKRREIQGTINRYNAILAPIRRIPVDILHKIFYHCLPTHRNSLMNATEAPVLLGRICSSWRATAISSPRLWAQLHVTFSNEYEHGDVFDPLQSHVSWLDTSVFKSKRDITTSLLLRCKVVEEWLSRTGTCPLSISVRYSSFFWDTNNQDPGQDITSQLFRVLARHSNRWQNIELTTPFEVYRILESMVALPELGMLESLKATFHQGFSSLSEDNLSVTIPKAENLRRLSISANRSFWNLPYIPPNWKKLTHLSCHDSFFAVGEILTLLNSCPNLIHLNVTMQSSLDQSTAMTHGREISLLYLRALHIVENIETEALGDLYDCIIAPRLEWINFCKHSSGNGPNRTPHPITALLRKSTVLRKLTMFTHSLTTSDIRQILRFSNNVTHLVLGPEIRDTGGSLRRTTGLVGAFIWNFGDIFDVDLKSAQKDSQEALLPRLQKFEVSNGMSIHIPDDTLLRFVLDRMDPVNGVAILKHVTVLFDRGKDMDIDADVHRYAQLQGVKIQLELDYAAPVLRKRPTYTGYRLDPDTDRSWNYTDFEDLEEMMFDG